MDKLLKSYKKPELEIELFEALDIVCESGGDNQGLEVEWYRPEFEDE